MSRQSPNNTSLTIRLPASLRDDAAAAAAELGISVADWWRRAGAGLLSPARGQNPQRCQAAGTGSPLAMS
jgi:hypothetical protein